MEELMKESYIKAIKVIYSCKNFAQITSAYNYIHNFRVLYGGQNGCKELTSKLHERCNKKRKQFS
tara:strand:- start:147 stop:341 length:195 start_codon:yes stop_codon:yes gene_type:complete